MVFFQEEVVLGANSVDLLGLDASGGITVVECKLDSNREARRMVVGQILEYASQLWGMDYEEFVGLMTKEGDPPLSDILRARLSAQWSDQAFRAGIETALHQGTFRLVIAISGARAELKEISEYLVERWRLPIEILELKLLSHDSLEILALESHGHSRADHSQLGTNLSAPKRSLEEFFASASNPESERKLRLVVDGWKAEKYLVVPGTRGVSFRVAVRGTADYIFWALNPEIFSFSKKGLVMRGVPTEAIQEFFASSGAIPSADDGWEPVRSATPGNED